MRPFLILDVIDAHSIDTAAELVLAEIETTAANKKANPSYVTTAIIRKGRAE